MQLNREDFETYLEEQDSGLLDKREKIIIDMFIDWISHPQPLEGAQVERVARALHETLSKLNVLAYLEMPGDTATVLAKAAISAMGQQPVSEERTEDEWVDEMAPVYWGASIDNTYDDVGLRAMYRALRQKEG